MMMKNRSAGCAFALALGVFLFGAAPSEAQEKSLGFYAGYAYLHTDDGNLNGVRLSPEYRINGLVSVAGDFSAEMGTIASTDATLVTFMGGVRLKKSLGGAAVYLHGLGGGVRTSSSITPFKGVSISVSDIGLGLDGGGGVEFKLNRFKMRVGGDYLRRKVDIGGGNSESVSDVRATIGLVF